MRALGICLAALTFTIPVRAISDQSPLSNEAACEVLIQAFPAASLHSDETKPGAKPLCDESSDSSSRYAVFGLHSDRWCDYMCSSLVGWYAVERTSRRIFDWDISQAIVGRLRWNGKGWIE
jgi:hypothetical protein